MPAAGSEPRLPKPKALLMLAKEQASDVTMGTSAREALLSALGGMRARMPSLVPSAHACLACIDAAPASTESCLPLAGSYFCRIQTHQS